MGATLKIINCPPSPYEGDPRHWNCVVYVAGSAYKWTPGYIFMIVDESDRQNSWEYVIWDFTLGYSQVSVTVDMQILEYWYSQFIYQRYGVAAVLKSNVDYVWNCAVHKIEELVVQPTFSELKISNYLKI